ncbi:hypothetical protein [Paenibacillus thalictri]|uniref:hypothetical protein n=1 Tax=Paenibacillus thalictri TaxID=2527873 RepID=UPI0013EF1EFA|nr:hypothetical protein [Paenibacillus thalictri]
MEKLQVRIIQKNLPIQYNKPIRQDIRAIVNYQSFARMLSTMETFNLKRFAKSTIMWNSSRPGGVRNHTLDQHIQDKRIKDIDCPRMVILDCDWWNARPSMRKRKSTAMGAFSFSLM